MTTTVLHEPPAATDDAAEPKQRRGRLVGIIAAGLVVVVGGVLLFGPRDDGAGWPHSVGSMQARCHQWASSQPATDAPPQQWCDDMAAWMRGHMGQNQVAGMGHRGMMMWQDPATMRANCEQWMQGRSDVTESSAWCAQMVTWMQGRMGDAP